MSDIREKLEKARKEAVRSRGFIRGAETQLTKTITAIDAALSSESSSSSISSESSSSSSSSQSQIAPLPIARWNVIPNQVINGKFKVGVVAFHPNGIEKVTFVLTYGDIWQEVYQAEYNERTKTTEYVLEIDADNVPTSDDGKISVHAIVSANNVAETMSTGIINLFTVNNNDAILEITPDTSITKALMEVGEGGTVVLSEPGIYQWHPDDAWSAWWHKSGVENNPDIRYKVKAASGIDRNDITVVSGPQLMRYETSVHWVGVSFDNALTGQQYGVRGSVFENCRFFDSRGWTAGSDGPFRDEYYAVDCLAEDKLYAFVGAALVRNCKARRISGDVLQYSQCVINCEIDNVDGTVLEHHTDIYQVFGKSENVIFYNVKATNLKNVQSFMMESFIGRDIENIEGEFDPEYTVKSMAVVNVDIENDIETKDRPPFSHMMGYFENLYFKNLRMPYQNILIRQQFAIGDVRGIVFKDCVLHPAVISSYENIEDEGVELINCQIKE